MSCRCDKPIWVQIQDGLMTCAQCGGNPRSAAGYPSPDPVNNPPHYTGHPSGIECIQITEHMGFNLGNAVKYVWRADLKGNAIEDLRKAVWYIEREIAKRGGVK